MPGNPVQPPAVPPPDGNPTSFVVDFDLAGLIAGLGIDCGNAEDQEAILAAEQAALAASPTPPVDVPGRVAGLLPTGPGLAAWLASASTSSVGDAELPDVALGYRRLAAWAQAQELAAVAEMASRAAIRRDRADEAGRPGQVLPEAGAEVALALTMAQLTAMDWTGLATRLRWQLPATGDALAAGQIDLARARIITEATAPLPDEIARVVEDRVLPAAGGQTTGQLRASVRRAVIAADPGGADRRRQHAERCAKVSLYPDHDGTATLVGTGLPGVSAAAALARITAIARALKKAGHSGGLDYLRAYTMLGLLLGTLPPTQPGSLIEGAPPGTPPPGTPPPGTPPPGTPPPGTPRPSAEPPDPADSPPVQPPPAALADPVDSPPVQPRPTALADLDRGIPNERDGDSWHGELDDDEGIDLDGAPVSWPPLPTGLLAPLSGVPPPRPKPGCPPPGLLDVLLPWSALTASPAPEPAVLGRIGPVTPIQTRQLLDLAVRHPATQWRIIVTDDDGYARAIERIRVRSPAGKIRAGPPTTPVIGRMTITIRADAVGRDQRLMGTGLRASLLRAAARAAARARVSEATDAAAGGCTHDSASVAYRPAPRLREFVVARDATCTFPPCGQPAWRADLDHAIPWHRGGPTCACNLSARCRTHHKIKQLPGWRLDQPQPGTLRWTTPAGRTYAVQPNRYPR